MNPGVELLKEMDPKKVEAWDRIHDKRKVFRCDRCGAEWKCEYGANTFGTSHEPNGDPDILCQCCGFPTVKEVKDVTCGDIDCANCVNGKCRINYHRQPDEQCCKEWVRC